MASNRLFEDNEILELKNKLLQRILQEVQEPLPNTRFLDVASKLIEALNKAIKGDTDASSIWERAKQILEEED